MTARLAAQYIRMSTDKQDLSPSVQKDAIAAYAAAREMQIVATYEDEGRSGDKGEDETDEDYVAQPKFREAKPFGEGSHADALKPGRRETQADGAAGTRER